MNSLSEIQNDNLKYGLFLGCIIPNRYPMIERSIRDVFDELGMKLLDLKGASCCPAPGVFRSFHNLTWLVIAARNISIAEKLGVSPITGCNGCYGTLRDVWYELNHNYKLKKDINKELNKIGKKYTGKYEPKHIVQVLYLDLGLDYLRNYIKYSFSNLKVAVHYGCHIVRPSDKRPWNNEYEYPTFLDEIVELTGANSIEYKDKNLCCGAGGGVRSAINEVAADFTKEKLINIRNAGVDIIITCCPFCQLQFDLGQKDVANLYMDEIKKPFNIPVIYITQLLGLSMGLDPNRLGLIKNHTLKDISPYISYKPFLKLIKEQLI
ncbi:MAG: CoB--CoM heterodisulfide reductase subunit B [Candidatus Lokiarchaeota archaeon]|nr:CoB--CoM heterodisulfide reductase subunit B [Candidatus Lokiarchaeota archaeon]